MKTCSVKTITEIKSSGISISCFADKNEDDTTYPDIYKADLLSEAKQINGIYGKEGELILAMSKEADADLIGENLIIELERDDVTKYEINNGNLEYNG